MAEVSLDGALKAKVINDAELLGFPLWNFVSFVVDQPLDSKGARRNRALKVQAAKS
jgi:hypothetical protein